MSVLNLVNIQEKTMTSLEIAELTGKQHKDVMRDIRNMLEALEIQSAQFCADYTDARGRTQQCFRLNRYYTEVLVTGYDVKRRAAVIKRWHDLETGTAAPAYQTPRMDMAAAVEGVAAIAKHLNYSNSAKAGAFSQLSEHYGIPSNVLKIEYAVDEGLETEGSSRVTKSISALLKDFELDGLSALRANKILTELGYLEEHQRQRSNGKVATFKAVTAAGQKYGKNITHTASQNQTQPHWFVDSFEDMLGEMIDHVEGIGSKSNVVNFRSRTGGD